MVTGKAARHEFKFGVCEKCGRQLVDLRNLVVPNDVGQTWVTCDNSRLMDYEIAEVQKLLEKLDAVSATLFQ